MVDLVRGNCFEMNRVGGSLWAALEQPSTFDQVCEAVQSRYAVSRDVIERDLAELVQQLAAASLVEVEPAR